MADIANLRPQQGTAARKGARRRDVPPKRMRKPVIYFAGRMNGVRSGNDWRDGLGGFKGGLYFNAAITYDNDGCFSHFRHDVKIDCGTFWYGGPFTLDTTSGHTNPHYRYFDDDPAAAERLIWDADRSWIERADLILAYIDDLYAYGTLVEIGYAAAKGKPIALGFSNNISLPITGSSGSAGYRRQRSIGARRSRYGRKSSTIG